jgi:broad specificity phosphatase PhoE
MTLLVLLRHAPTEWNKARRLQGRADIALADASRRALAARQLPAEFRGLRALCSPLLRCRQTAELLGIAAPAIEPRLIEMDWGAYEGHTLKELHEKHGFDMAANEARGLDFRPPNGESPRDVQTRIAPLLAEIAAAGEPTIAVTHRGVIRAVYAWALDWDMLGEPAHSIDLYALQIFVLEKDGTPRIDRLNLALEPRG